MKKLVLLLLLPLFVQAQTNLPKPDSAKLTSPPIVGNFTPANWYYRGGNASNGEVGFFNTVTGKWVTFVTGYQASKYLLSKSDSTANSGYITHGYFNNYAVKKITTIIYADNYTDSLATAIFNNGAGINTGSAIVKAINVAHALGGGIIMLSNKTYLPTGYSETNPMLFDNISIEGIKQPYFSVDCKSLTDGTIILGGYWMFANNFSITDVGFDAGKTVCDSYYAATPQQPFVFVGSTPTHKATTTKSNIFAENITCLSYSPPASAHGFLLENASSGYINNILTCYGIYGSIIKSDNIIVGSMKAYENSTYPFIIKSDSVDNIAIAKNVTINSLTYDLAPPNTTPYVSAPPPIAALNIDANGNDVTNIHIGEINILTTVDYGDYFSAFIGNINGVKIDHTNILADSTNVGVYIAENNVTGLYFGEINAHNTSDPYYDNSTSIGTNYIGNLIADNHGVSPGAQGIFLNGSGKRLNIGAYYSNNNTDTYNLASGDTVAVANENIINNTTYNAGAGIIIAKANTNGSNASGTWPIAISGNAATSSTSPLWNGNTILNGFYTSGTINAILLNNSTNSRIEFGSATTIKSFLGLSPSDSPTFSGGIFGGIVNLKNYTVSTLPTGTRGDIAYVTDALTPVALATVVGGGATVVPVFYNGTNWIVQ